MFGRDYQDSFTLVAKFVAIRVLLAIAAQKGWHVNLLDINNAFLHDTIDEELYLTPPQGLTVHVGHVFKHTKALYGLKQASR